MAEAPPASLFQSGTGTGRFAWLRARLAEPRGALALIGLLSIVVYANSLANQFAFDDWRIIRVNPRLHQLDDLGLIVGTPYWPAHGEMLGLYRPLTVLAFAVQWVLTGGAAWLFHLVNVAMHATVSVLVLLLVRRFASLEAALVGALVFAVHPVHTEAVANIVGQAELWAGLSVVGGCIVFLGRGPNEPLGLRRLLAIAALYSMGLLAKEHSIVLPGMLAALEMARSPLTLRDYLRRHVDWLVPSFLLLAALAGTYLAIRYSVLGSIAGHDAGPQFPFLRGEYRVFTALRAWPEYMRLLFLPIDLSADYAPGVILPIEGGITPMMGLGAAILGGLVLLAAVTPWRPGVGLPAAWFFIAILPVSNLLFPIGVVLAERTLYLPSVALAFLIAFAWDSLVRRAEAASPQRARRIAWVAAAGCIVLFGALTIARNPVWKTSQSVVDSVIRDHPESYRAQYNAGVLAAGDGDTARAIYHWELSSRIYDRDALLLTNIGSFYLSMHRYQRALELLRPAFELHDDLLLNVIGLAVAELGVGNARESLRVSQHGFETFGALPVFFDLRARAQLALDQPGNAAASWRTAIRLGSDGWVQWAQLARALSEIDSTAAALAALDSAIARADSTAGPARVEGLRGARTNLER
ncbi:MAG: tetratricopeptide repeat protein [Gemmatimonadota bacterium]